MNPSRLTSRSSYHRLCNPRRGLISRTATNCAHLSKKSQSESRKEWLKFNREVCECSRPVVRTLPSHPLTSKYVVLTQVNENLGQGGRYECAKLHCIYEMLTLFRVDILCHWQEGDCVAQEMFTNVSVPVRSQWIILLETDVLNPGLSDLYMHSTGYLLIVSFILDTLHHHSHTVIRGYPIQDTTHGKLVDRPIARIAPRSSPFSDAVSCRKPAAGVFKARSSSVTRSVSSPHKDLHRILPSSIKTQTKINPRPSAYSGTRGGAYVCLFRR